MARAAFRSVLLTALILAGAALVPGAEAAAFRINEPLPVELTMEVPSGIVEVQERLVLFGGALEASGNSTGPVVLIDAASDASLGASTIRVWDRDDVEGLARGVPAFEATGGVMLPHAGMDLMWSVGRTSVSGSVGFGFSLYGHLLDHAESLGPAAPALTPEGPALVTTMDGAGWGFVADDVVRTFILPLSDSAFTVRTENGDERSFEGDRWFVTMRGEQGATLDGALLVLPTGPDLVLSYTRAGSSVFEAAFTTDAITSFMGLIGGFAGATPEGPPDADADAFERAPAEDSGTGNGTDGSEGDVLAMSSSDIGDGALFDDRPPDSLGAWHMLRSTLSTEPDRTVWDLLDQPDGPDGNDTDDSSSVGRADGMGDGAPQLGFDLGAIASLGDFANGIIVGNVSGDLKVAGQEVDDPGGVLLRFESLTLTDFSKDGPVSGSGSAAFVVADGGVVAGADAPTLGFLGLPALSWTLYVFALAAWLFSRFRTLRDKDDALTAKLRPLALASAIVLTIVSLILWDREVNFLIGTSLFSQLGFAMVAPLGDSSGAPLAAVGGGEIGLGIVALLELGFWAVAGAFFGFPVRVIARSGLKVAGLGKRSYGFATGLAAFMSWLWGAAYLLPLLGMVVERVVAAL